MFRIVSSTSVRRLRLEREAAHAHAEEGGHLQEVGAALLLEKVGDREIDLEIEPLPQTEADARRHTRDAPGDALGTGHLYPILTLL